MRKIFIVFGILAVLVGVGALGYFQVKAMRREAAARQEIVTQEEEKKECKRRLGLFYSAWKQYRADHKGADPASIEALFPRYLKDASLLLCPTAKRWQDKGKRFEQGSVEINKTSFPVTYGFQWLTSAVTRNRKLMGDQAPLVSCEMHRLAIYQVVFKKGAKLGAFDDEQRQHYPAELRDAPVLAVLQSGNIIEQVPDKLKK